MAVTIRCSRIGRVHRPFFRIGAYDSRTRRDGEALEYLGYYDPIQSTKQPIKLNTERIEAWLKKGAMPSALVGRFLSQAGIKWSKAARDRSRNDKHAEKRKAARAKKKSAKATAAAKPDPKPAAKKK